MGRRRRRAQPLCGDAFLSKRARERRPHRVISHGPRHLVRRQSTDRRLGFLQRQLRQRGGHLLVYYRRDQCLLAGAVLANSAAELTRIYSNLGSGNIYDVQYGTCGPREVYLTRVGVPGYAALQYDACTGMGTPLGRGAF
jgi:hypothetical protein